MQCLKAIHNTFVSPLVPLFMPISVMAQLPDLLTSQNNTQLILVAVTCLGLVAARAYLLKPESLLPLPPSPPTWRLLGHPLPRKE